MCRCTSRYYDGDNGETLRVEAVGAERLAGAEAVRQQLVEAMAWVRHVFEPACRALRIAIKPLVLY